MRHSPRRKALNIPGHAHELTFSCYRRYRLLESDLTRQWLADAINHAREVHNFALWAFVIMPGHVHLMIYPRATRYSMADIMTSIKQPVSRRALRHIENVSPHWENKLTRKRGKRTERMFWQSGGGYDRNVTEPSTLWKMIDYIHNNPVRKQLVERASQWLWSSASFHETGECGPIRVDHVDW